MPAIFNASFIFIKYFFYHPEQFDKPGCHTEEKKQYSKVWGGFEEIIKAFANEDTNQSRHHEIDANLAGRGQVFE